MPPTSLPTVTWQQVPCPSAISQFTCTVVWVRLSVTKCLDGPHRLCFLVSHDRRPDALSLKLVDPDLRNLALTGQSICRSHLSNVLFHPYRHPKCHNVTSITYITPVHLLSHSDYRTTDPRHNHHPLIVSARLIARKREIIIRNYSHS